MESLQYSPPRSPSPLPTPTIAFTSPNTDAASIRSTRGGHIPQNHTYTTPTATPASVRKSATPARKTYKRLAAAERKLALQAAVRKRTAKADTPEADAPATPAAARAIVCKWQGCKQRLANGSELWRHIETVHDPLGEGGSNVDEGYDDDSCDKDERMEIDAPQIAMDPDSAEEDEVDEPDVGATRHCHHDRVVESASARRASGWCGRSTKLQHYMDRYQTKIRCEWERCTTTIQFAGLRRHIESKHSGLRNTCCPKGCGYWTNRPDMMPRHAQKCHYRGPKRQTTVEE